MASLDAGLEFSYRINIKERFKLQPTAFYAPIPIFSNIAHFFLLGLSAQYSFINLEKIGFYGYLGSHAVYQIDDLIYPLEGFAGSGLGTNIAISERLSLQVQAGLGVEFMNFNKIPIKGYGFHNFFF